MERGKHGRFSKMHLSTQGYVVVKAPEDYENAFTDGRVLERRFSCRNRNSDVLYCLMKFVTTLMELK